MGTNSSAKAIYGTIFFMNSISGQIREAALTQQGEPDV